MMIIIYNYEQLYSILLSKSLCSCQAKHFHVVSYWSFSYMCSSQTKLFLLFPVSALPLSEPPSSTPLPPRLRLLPPCLTIFFSTKSTFLPFTSSPSLPPSPLPPSPSFFSSSPPNRLFFFGQAAQAAHCGSAGSSGESQVPRGAFFYLFVSCYAAPATDLW